eukprot:COSAG05_NODE_777_length_7405_cov_27.513961_7_plen_146_part_00
MLVTYDRCVYRSSDIFQTCTTDIYIQNDCAHACRMICTRARPYLSLSPALDADTVAKTVAEADRQRWAGGSATEASTRSYNFRQALSFDFSQANPVLPQTLHTQSGKRSRRLGSQHDKSNLYVRCTVAPMLQALSYRSFRYRLRS